MYLDIFLDDKDNTLVISEEERHKVKYDFSIYGLLLLYAILLFFFAFLFFRIQAVFNCV